VRYLRCRGCGQQLRGVIADPSEVDVRSLDAAPPTSDSESDPIDAATLAEVRRTLAGWQVRLACVRSERRVAAGLPPLAEDLRLLGPVVVTWDGVLVAFYADDEDPRAAETEHLIAVELGRLDADARTLDDASRVATRVAGDRWCGWE
jgi:hypothetical protein